MVQIYIITGTWLQHQLHSYRQVMHLFRMEEQRTERKPSQKQQQEARSITKPNLNLQHFACIVA
jgi:hypothetical protein